MYVFGYVRIWLYMYLTTAFMEKRNLHYTSQSQDWDVRWTA